MAGAMLMQPVIDGDVILAAPLERIRAGSAAGVDVIVGTNTDDWRLFLAVTGTIDQITDEIISGPVEQYGFQTAAAYGLAADVRASLPGAHPAATPGELLAAIQTDWWCRIPAIRLADAHATHLAHLHVRVRLAFAGRRGMFGACHALEIPFVFDTLDLGTGQMIGDFLGDAPPQELAGTMHPAWVSFATR